MQVATEQFTWVTENRLLGPAEILKVDPAGRRVRLRLAGSEDNDGVWARLAMAADCELDVGDQVLVIGDSPSALYVIGLLASRESASVASKKLLLNGGAYATAGGPREEQTLRVFSGRSELLFEYDEAKRRARVNIENGDLEFVAMNGNIAFSSGRDVLIQGQSVGISSPSSIRIGTTDAGGKLQAAVSLQDQCIELRGTEGRLAVERLQIAAQTLIEKAKNVFRTVEQLAQLKAGRIRTLVDSTYFFKAKRAFIKSEEDYKIKAEKIHLG
jgi:hypothetical protein